LTGTAAAAGSSSPAETKNPVPQEPPEYRERPDSDPANHPLQLSIVRRLEELKEDCEAWLDLHDECPEDGHCEWCRAVEGLALQIDHLFLSWLDGILVPEGVTLGEARRYARDPRLDRDADLTYAKFRPR
jgi:hypothetical protein